MGLTTGETEDAADRVEGVARQEGAGGEVRWEGTAEGEGSEGGVSLPGVGAAVGREYALGAATRAEATATASLSKSRRRPETEPEPAFAGRPASGVDKAIFAPSVRGPKKDSASRTSSAMDLTLSTGSTSGTESDGDQWRVGPRQDGLSMAEWRASSSSSAFLMWRRSLLLFSSSAIRLLRTTHSSQGAMRGVEKTEEQGLD